MKIRNLQEFIKNRCGNPSVNSLDLLFSDDRNEEPFLRVVLGDEGNVDNMVTNCASFAKDAEQQVFYEFVQNAFDANGDSAFFFAGTVKDKDYLLVLNNGKPFFTDPKEVSKQDKREGQLFSFLNKGKSDKPNEPSIGKFGMGSKLLYTLLTDYNEKVSTSKLMKPTLVDARVAPYLLSWTSGCQLDNFLLDRNEWDRSCGFDNTEFLIAKILCCYYPIEPGVSEELFPNTEVSQLADVFNTLVTPVRNANRFQTSSGTALIIPLGKGKLNMLTEEQRITKIGDCLAPFTAIISGYDEFAGKHLSCINLLGRTITGINADNVSVNIEYEVLDKIESPKYQFVFDESLICANTVNLYKALPISDSVYNLNFIIDSQDLPVDDSRQSINEVDVAINNITSAMEKFVTELESLKESDNGKYNRIYRCLVSSRPNNEIVKKPFDAVILPYLRNNVKVSDGTFKELENVRDLTCDFSIPIDELGINNIFAADDTYKNDYDALGITISKLSLSDIVKLADKEKLTNWIKGLSEEHYAAYHNEIVKIIKNHTLENLLLTNKGNVISYNDLVSEDKDIFFADIASEVLSTQSLLEYATLPLGIAKPPQIETLIWSKIISKQAFYTSIEYHNTICGLLHAIESKVTSKKIRENISILMNMGGNAQKFYDLFKTRPQDTVLFEQFVARAPLPSRVGDNWFVQDSEIWKWIERNLSQLKALTDWDQFHMRYISDMIKIWSKDTSNSKNKICVYLNENGIPVEEPCFCIKGTRSDEYPEDNYNVLKQIFKDYTIIPYKFRNILSKDPFKIDTIEFGDLFSNSESYLTIDSNAFAVVLDIVPKFWDYYTVTEIEEGLQIRPLNKKNEERNYWSLLCLSAECEKTLSDASFIRVSNNIKRPDDAYIIEQNSILLKNAIEKVSSNIQLFPIVKKCTGVLNTYCDKLEDLDFSGEKIPEDSIKWEIIKWFSDQEEIYKDAIWNKISINGEKLPNGKLCPNSVKVKDGDTYRAFDLVPRLATDDEIVSKLLEIVPSRNIFESKYCKKRRDIIKTTEVLSELNYKALSIYQLEFALDCAKHELNVTQDLYLANDSDISEALEKILERKFEHFYRKFIIPGLDTKRQIFASEKYLLESEQLPVLVRHWLKKHETGNVFDLFDDDQLHRFSPFINARKALLDGTSCSIPTQIEDTDYWILKNTLDWIISKQSDKSLVISHGSNAYGIVKDLQALIKPETNKIPLLLGYTQYLTDKDELIYELCAPSSKDVKFLSIKSDDQRKRLGGYLRSKNETLIQFLEKEKLFIPMKGDLMRKHSLANNTILSLKYESSRESSWSEWDDGTYNKWLLMEESEGIRIFISSKPITSLFRFMDGKDSLLDLPITEGATYGYTINEKGKLTEVTVMFPNNADNNVFKALENNAVSNIPEFQAPFIALQGLKLEELMDVDNPDIIQLISKLSEEDLNKLKEGKLGFGNGNGPGNGYGSGSGSGNGNGQDKDKDKEEDDETKENKISGFIGELLYKEFLIKKGQNYKWAAREGEGRYDFSIDDSTFIEIKTNVRTIKDGKSPFYLHKSQMEFLHTIDTDKYHICRISLADLGLGAPYKKIRNYYGTYEDPLNNLKLQQSCEELVNQYWSTNSIDDFIHHRRLYRIKDLFLNPDNL